MEIRTCLHCRKILKRRQKKFCSLSCVSQYYGKKRIIETQRNKTCEECGKIFIIRKGDKRRFCSNTCANRNMIKKRDKEKRVWWKCPICHKKFYWQRNKARNRKYCSVKCQAVGASLRLRGKIRKEKVNGKREIKIYPNIERVYVKGKRKVLHRHLMEEKLGRELKSSEHVHHIDMDRNNNIIENLYLFENNRKHMKGHFSLYKLVASLIEAKIIGFKNGRYFMQGTNRKSK